MGKVVKIHLYTKSHIFGKSKCGLDYEKLEDHSNQLKWVTCKKCKQWKQEKKN